MAITKKKYTRHHASDIDLYDDIEKIKDALKDAATDVKGKAGEVLFQTLDDARETYADKQERVRDYVEARPFGSLGIAVLAGMFIGYFIHR